MSASSFSGFPADARILGLDIGSISVDVVLLDGLGTPLPAEPSRPPEPIAEEERPPLPEEPSAQEENAPPWEGGSKDRLEELIGPGSQLEHFKIK